MLASADVGVCPRTSVLPVWRVLTAVLRSVATQIFNVLNTLGPPTPPAMPAFNASIFASQLKVRPSAFWLARHAN